MEGKNILGNENQKETISKEIKAAWIAGILGIIGSVISGIIGSYVGKNAEQKIIQAQILKVNDVNVSGIGNNIAINSVDSLVSSYLELQANYSNLQENNNTLLKRITELTNDLEIANNSIEDLKSDSDNEIQNLRDELNEKYNVDFDNINLVINGISSDYVGRTATINNETFYSLGFMQYMVDNQAVSSDGAKLFIGNVQSEDMMPVSLFEEDTYLECGYLAHGYSISGNIETTNSFIDNKGNEYFSGVYRWIPNFDSSNTYIECLVDEYSTFTGTIILNHTHTASKSKARLIIYGDGEVIYASKDITRGVDPVDFSIDITNISLLRIEFTKEYEVLALVNPLLFP